MKWISCFVLKFAVDRARPRPIVLITHVSVRQIGVSPPFLIDSLKRAISRRITSLWGETLTQVRNVFGFRHRPKSFIHYHNAFVQILPRIHFRFLSQSTSHALVTNPLASIMTIVADAESVSIVGRVKMNVSIIKREVNLGTSEVISCINFLHVLEISSQKCWIHCISRFPSVGHRCVSCDVKIL